MIFNILKVALVSLTITVGVAFTVVLTQRPKAVDPRGTLDFGNQLAQDVSDPAPLLAVRMRDGYALHYRDYPATRATAPQLVMVHGSGWHSLKFSSVAKALQGKAHLIDPDLHGHGTAPGRRGDVDYIGQFGDNMGDLVATLCQHAACGAVDRGRPERGVCRVPLRPYHGKCDGEGPLRHSERTNHLAMVNDPRTRAKMESFLDGF